VPITIPQHRVSYSSNTTFRDFLQQYTALLLREVEDKDKIQPGYVYLTPADYHLLVEPPIENRDKSGYYWSLAQNIRTGMR
jgi:two-component system, chemotaxis family, protein-glutamate methylesterase/glutaminase